MGSFSIALTGLQADSVALNTIGNNLANINSTAYKGQSTTFEDLFYQQVGESGSGDAIQVGLGTKVSGTATNYLQGTLSTTPGNSANMALNGNGFFVVQRGGVQSLTRAGNFQLDPKGNLTTVDGESVMGYQAVNGTLASNGPLTPLQLPVGSTEAAQATQNFSITANLNAGAATGTSFSTPVTIYDSLGQSQIATVTYTKSAANTWGYAVTLPAGVATGTPLNNTGTLTFDSSGNLVSPSSDVSNITFPSMSDGASDLTLNWNLYGGAGAPLISQTTAASTTTGSGQDGFPSGVYQSFAVDPAGIITASYSNGNTTQVGQIAVATVANMEGLTVAGNNNFTTTGASGLASIGVAGAGGRGTIQDDELELSNVDISTEFANLIVAQRAFEANSKTMTTFDTISQDAIGMIR
jgi:flagellar hook protein FlgE